MICKLCESECEEIEEKKHITFKCTNCSWRFSIPKENPKEK